MGTTPQYAATVNNSAVLLGTRDSAAIGTALSAPVNVGTLWTPGGSGGKVEEITCEAIGTTAAGIVNLFLYDGATYHLYDQIAVSAVTASATALSFRALPKQYPSLILKSTFSIRATHMCGAATNDSLLKLQAFGGDF